MKVLITNTVALNGGDAAILHAIVRLVREAFGEDTDVVVCDVQAPVAARYYPDLRFSPTLHDVASRPPVPYLRGVLRPLNKARIKLAARLLRQGATRRAMALLTPTERDVLRHYHEADIVVATGGTYLVEKYDLTGPLFELEVARILDRPVVLFTQSLGPFRDPRNREAMREVVDDASLVLLRDARSRDHLVAVGAETGNLHVSADAAFALGDGDDPAPSPNGPPRVAISIRHWPYFKNLGAEEGMARFTAAIADLVGHLIEKHDADITFLSTCQGIPEYWANDAAVAHDVVARLPAHHAARVHVDEAFHDPRDLVDVLRGFDVTVATRMHMAILSLVAGTPVLPIAYEFKTTELFDRLGMGKWVHDIEDMEGATLTRSMDALLASLPMVRQEVHDGVGAERQRAREAVQLLREVHERHANVPRPEA